MSADILGDADIAPSDHDFLQTLLNEALERPSPEGARIVVLWWLHHLQEARAAWADGPAASQALADSEDAAELLLPASDHAASEAPAEPASEVLHDARVALRRLRASFREYRKLLDGEPRKRDLRHLRRLGRATNRARNTHVQLAWLDKEGTALAPDAQAEAATLRERLLGESARHEQRVTDAFAKHLDPHVQRLQKRLLRFTVQGAVGVPLNVHPFSHDVARRLERAIADVAHALQQAGDVNDTRELHEVRLALKTVRALLVPFVSELPALATLYATATRGQDALGAMRDAGQLADRARSEDMEALAAALDNVQLDHFRAFASEWLADGGAAALASATAARDALLSTSSASRSAQGGTAPREIERKYLLSGCPPEAAVVAGTRIEQGYLPGRTLRERLRCSTYPTGVARYTRTVKFGRGIQRVELEEDADRALFDALWPLTVAARVRKRRHAIREGGYTWEIDVFTDRDLVLAEVELTSADEAPELPAWLARWVVREVTGEAEFVNANLARPDAPGGDSPAAPAAG